MAEPQPSFQIEKIYVKDLSLELPNAPQVFFEREAPQVEVYILPSAKPPTGVGEPGTPVVGPAVANALLTLTGKPVTALPIVKA